MVRANSATLYILIKVLQLLNANLISRPAVFSDCDSLGRGYVILLILGSKVVLARKDDKWWDYPPYRVDALDHRSPFAIA